MQPQMRSSKIPEENLLGSFSQSASSTSADLNMTQMGVVGTNAAFPRSQMLNGRVNFPQHVPMRLAQESFICKTVRRPVRPSTAATTTLRISLTEGNLPKATFKILGPIPELCDPKLRNFAGNEKNPC